MNVKKASIVVHVQPVSRSAGATATCMLYR